MVALIARTYEARLVTGFGKFSHFPNPNPDEPEPINFVL